MGGGVARLGEDGWGGDTESGDEIAAMLLLVDGEVVLLTFSSVSRASFSVLAEKLILDNGLTICVRTTNLDFGQVWRQFM